MFAKRKCLLYGYFNIAIYDSCFNLNKNDMKEKIVQIIITNSDVKDKARENHYVVNGIEELDSAIGILRFNSKEVIYVHLTEPIEIEAMSRVLNLWCKKLEEKRGVSCVKHQIMGMPENQKGFHTIVDANNRLIENRYIVSYNY